MEIVKVGIAEYKIGSSPDVLSCVGLGSCVGVALYDPKSKIGGLAHVVLPDSSEARTNPHRTIKPAKFADTAIAAALESMLKAKAQKRRITAKIVGGASMFSSDGSKDSIFDVGRRNVDAVKEVLKKERIKVLTEDTGGSTGRSLNFYTESGRIVVRSKSNSIEI